MVRRRRSSGGSDSTYRPTNRPRTDAGSFRARQTPLNTPVYVPDSTVTGSEPLMSASVPMSDGPSGNIGPANWVDPVTYRKLRTQFRKRYSKKTTTRKTPVKRRRYNRYGYRRTYGGRQLSGMGPIVITGRGGYFTDKLKSGASAAWKSIKRLTPEGTFQRLGTAAGGAMYGAPGATAGGWLGQGVSNILGFGEYGIRKNELLTINEGVPVPTFQDMNQGIIVSHREWVADITQTEAFSIQSYALNPGLHATFPWLSSIAPAFDQYEILGMLWQFRSTSSDSGTTLPLGNVIMATDYDVADAEYTSKMQMENSQYVMSGKPSIDILHPIECDPSVTGPMGLKYVRNHPVPEGKDQRLYDHGRFSIATTGMPASTGTIGELWVTYKIALYKPQIHDPTIMDVFSGTSSLTISALTGIASGVSNPAVTGSTLGGTLDGNTYYFPLTHATVGDKYRFHYIVVGDSTTLTNAFTATATNVTVTAANKSKAGSADTFNYYEAYVTIASLDNPRIQLTAATFPGNPVKGILTVQKVINDITYSYS